MMIIKVTLLNIFPTGSLMETLHYSKMTAGVSDASVFNIPSICTTVTVQPTVSEMMLLCFLFNPFLYSTKIQQTTLETSMQIFCIDIHVCEYVYINLQNGFKNWFDADASAGGKRLNKTKQR